MRGHGSLQQLLGKRIGSSSKQQKRQEDNSVKRPAGTAGAADGSNSTPGGQSKLSAFFQLQGTPAAAPKRKNQSTLAPAPNSTRQRISHELPPRPDPTVFTLNSRIVGRQHQGTEQQPPSTSEELLLVREPSNPVDPCAILVCSRNRAGGLRPHGHLPASVSSHLAALIDASQIDITTHLVDEAAAAAAENSSPADTQDPAAAAAAAGPDAATQPQSSAAAAAASLTGSSSGTNSSGRSLARSSSGSQMWRVKLTVSLVNAGGQQAADVAAALQLAAAAGEESLEPGKNNGAVLTASFDHILQQARQYDFHLLDDQEQAVLQHMQALPAPAKSLLLRLLLRRRTWFALDALHYSEVPDTPGAAQQLAASGLVVWSHEAAADLDSLLPELPVPALKQVLAALLPRNHPAVVAANSGAAAAAGSNGLSAKAALISSIQSNACRVRLQSAINAAAGVWLAVLPAVADTFGRLQHLYFLTQGQDLGMFLAVDRGVLRYPPYTISRARPVFACRQDLLDYEQAVALAGEVDAALEEGDHNGAWQLLQPALVALQAGVHKSIVWDESHGAVMPNPPPPQLLLQLQQQQLEQQHLAQQQQLHSQQQRHQQQQQGHVQQAESPDRHRSPSPRPTSSYSFSQRGSRSQSPSPSSNSPGSDDDSSSATSSSLSHSRRGSSHSSSTTSSSARPGTASQPVTLAAAEASTAPITPAADPAAAEPVPLASEQPPPPPAVPAGPAVPGPAAGPPPLFLARFCAGWVYASLGTIAVSLLEKRKAWGEAVDLLRLLLGGNACGARRGDWWSRLAINLEHQGLQEQALEAVEASLADSWVRWGDLLGLQRRLLRLGKPPRRWKRPPWAPQVVWEPREVNLTARPLANTTGTKSRFYGLDDSQVTVEGLALQHYASAEGGGWQGLHCEGGVWATLFGLLLWDQLFMAVPDVFRSPFQTSPLDLESDAFYPARREQLDRQLSRIADGQAGAILSAVWSAHAGVMCRGVNWQRFSQQQLLDICECVGGLGLAAVLRLMAEDHKGATGGLPDLLLWRPSDRTAKMVEVKGPRDRLSHQQLFWLAHMANSTIQVEVLKVREPASTSCNK